MSVQRTSLTEELALTRVRDSFADWFDSFEEYVSAARSASPSSASGASGEWDPPEQILVRGAGELHPATAGAMAGAVAGPAATAAATMLASRTALPADLAGTIAALLTRGATHTQWIGWPAVVAFGAAIGAVFAMITRRLRSFAPMMALGMILSASTWTVVHGVALPRIAPWLATTLPYAPMVIASALFGVVLALQVPIRTRRLVGGGAGR